MNRAERRKLKMRGTKEPIINVKVSDLGKMTPTQISAMRHEINQQCLEADARLTADVDAMVLWTLHQHCGFGPKRLHDFYVAMAKEHKRMRDFYEMDDLYPERHKLKEMGVDVEAWEKEIEVYR